MCYKWVHLEHVYAQTQIYTNVSKPAQLKVNTPACCSLQIRQFRRRGKKRSLFTWEKASAATWAKGSLFTLCDWVCAQLNMSFSTRQSLYCVCHIVRKGSKGSHGLKIRSLRGGEERKGERIKSVTSCVNPGFSLTLTQLYCSWNAAELSLLSIPPKPHKCLHFYQILGNFLTFFTPTCLPSHLIIFSFPEKCSIVTLLPFLVLL